MPLLWFATSTAGGGTACRDEQLSAALQVPHANLCT